MAKRKRNNDTYSDLSTPKKRKKSLEKSKKKKPKKPDRGKPYNRFLQKLFCQVFRESTAVQDLNHGKPFNPDLMFYDDRDRLQFWKDRDQLGTLGDRDQLGFFDDRDKLGMLPDRDQKEDDMAMLPDRDIVKMYPDRFEPEEEDDSEDEDEDQNQQEQEKQKERGKGKIAQYASMVMFNLLQQSFLDAMERDAKKLTPQSTFPEKLIEFHKMVHAQVTEHPAVLNTVHNKPNPGFLEYLEAKDKISITVNPGQAEKLTLEDIVTTEMEKQFDMELDMIYNSYREYLQYQYELGILDVATEEEELIDFLSVFENFFKQETAKPDLDPDIVDLIVDKFVKKTGKLIDNLEREVEYKNKLMEQFGKNEKYFIDRLRTEQFKGDWLEAHEILDKLISDMKEAGWTDGDIAEFSKDVKDYLRERPISPKEKLSQVMQFEEQLRSFYKNMMSEEPSLEMLHAKQLPIPQGYQELLKNDLLNSFEKQLLYAGDNESIEESLRLDQQTLERLESHAERFEALRHEANERDFVRNQRWKMKYPSALNDPKTTQTGYSPAKKASDKMKIIQQYEDEMREIDYHEKLYLEDVAQQKAKMKFKKDYLKKKNSKSKKLRRGDVYDAGYHARLNKAMKQTYSINKYNKYTGQYYTETVGFEKWMEHNGFKLPKEEEEEGDIIMDDIPQNDVPEESPRPPEEVPIPEQEEDQPLLNKDKPKEKEWDFRETREYKTMLETIKEDVLKGNSLLTISDLDQMSYKDLIDLHYETTLKYIDASGAGIPGDYLKLWLSHIKEVGIGSNPELTKFLIEGGELSLDMLKGLFDLENIAFVVTLEALQYTAYNPDIPFYYYDEVSKSYKWSTEQNGFHAPLDKMLHNMHYYEFMKLYEKHKYAYTALAILTADPMLGSASVVYWGTDFQENKDEAKILAEMAAKGESTTAMLSNRTPYFTYNEQTVAPENAQSQNFEAQVYPLGDYDPLSGQNSYYTSTGHADGEMYMYFNTHNNPNKMIHPVDSQGNVVGYNTLWGPPQSYTWATVDPANPDQITVHSTSSLGTHVNLSNKTIMYAGKPGTHAHLLNPNNTEDTALFHNLFSTEDTFRNRTPEYMTFVTYDKDTATKETWSALYFHTNPNHNSHPGVMKDIMSGDIEVKHLSTDPWILPPEVGIKEEEGVITQRSSEPSLRPQKTQKQRKRKMPVKKK